MNPSPSRPTLYGPLHPAHPGDGTLGVLAWLGGSKQKPAARRSVPSGMTAWTATANRLVRSAWAKGRHLAARRTAVRPIHWAAGAAVLLGAGLIGALALFLSEPPVDPLAASSGPARASARVQPALPASPSPVPQAHARIERVEPIVPAQANTSSTPSTDKPVPARPSAARTPSRPAVASPVASPAGPVATDLDTEVIESILPHLPAPRDDTTP